MERIGSSKSKKQQPDNSKIELFIKWQDGDIIKCGLACDKKLQHLFQKFCQAKNIDYTAVEFLCDGRRLQAKRTPLELGLVDGDEIDAMVHQNGGGHLDNGFSLFSEDEGFPM